MSQLVIIPIEGVLAAGDDLRSAAATRWARPFYSAMHAQYRLCGLSYDAGLAQWWLKKEMMGEWAMVLNPTGMIFFEDWKTDVVRDMLAKSWEIAWFVDTDPNVLQGVRSMGVQTMHLGTPVKPPGWKEPGEEYVPWEALASDTVVPGA